MNILWLTILVLGATGLLAALVLFFVAKKFYVYENPRIGEVEALLPGANCGACGYKGCHDFAVAASSATSLEGINCPGAGKAGMDAIAILLGLKATSRNRKVALLACAGTCDIRPECAVYTGPRSCAMQAAVCSGTTACPYGCLGCGDCVRACPHGAMSMNPATGLPEVNTEKCTGCGVCGKACPRSLLKMAVLPREYHSITHVACSNADKGAMAMKACPVSCIACGKCVRTCPASAIKIEGQHAVIDSQECTRCGACIEVCPRSSILSTRIAEYHRS